MQAQRLRFTHMDMNHLEEQLVAAKDARIKLVVTDGVFSMDGDIAPLDQIVELAHAHDAQVVVDECHATGVLGAKGRGTDEHHGVLGKVPSFAAAQALPKPHPLLTLCQNSQHTSQFPVSTFEPPSHSRGDFPVSVMVCTGNLGVTASSICSADSCMLGFILRQSVPTSAQLLKSAHSAAMCVPLESLWRC